VPDRRTCFAALACLLLTPPCLPAAAAADAGNSIYLSGQSASGAPIEARVSGDIPLAGKAAACANCHRPSGFGTSEGQARSLPITASALFADRPPPAPRPAYDDATLLRAITSGVSASGRMLDPLMPRYHLDRSDAEALLAHLHSLGSKAAPGVSEDEIVLATVVSDSAPAAQRAAVTQVLERFVQVKNGGSRQEARRAEIARRHPFGERHDRGWRRWRLVTWQLQGPPSGWAEQMRALYAADPPFLLLSGAVGEHWSEVHEFCEARRLPCVLPQTGSPPEADGSFYSVYFNEGARLDGAVIARHASRTLGGGSGRMLVIHPTGEQARSALDSLRDAWVDSGQNAEAIQARTIGNGQASARYWLNVLKETRPRVLVAWTAPAQLAGLEMALRSYTSPLTIYTSETFTHWTADIALQTHPQLWHVHPFNYAQGNRPAFAREAQWLRAQKLQDLDPLAASQALFACHVVGEQLAALTGNFSPEYFIEGLEHMLDSTNMTSLVPRTTLGQGQRFISRGAYVLPASSLVGGTAAGSTWVEQ
jgi:hypothetical protein